MVDYYDILGPLLRKLPPETAHRIAILALAKRLLPSRKAYAGLLLSQDLMGLHFPNPIGLAAGFDKNAEAVDGLLLQGFGFVEAGTVTRFPQEGNPRPRLFRLEEDRAVINRLGFNNEGIDRFLQNLARHDRTLGIVGVNIGKNRDAANAVKDYTDLLEASYALADYVTVNISSPNTQGLRQLQAPAQLTELLASLSERRAALAARTARHVPILVKIAPDVAFDDVEGIVTLVREHGMEGMIVSNTTISRPEFLRSPQRSQEGGLSGAPLFALSTRLLSHCRRVAGTSLVLVGVGGVGSAADAYAKIRAGASLVQCYTSLIYHGIGLVTKINRELESLLRRDGFTSVSQAVGVDSEA